MANPCKKCLLLEAGETASYQNVQEYLKTLPAADKVMLPEYERRLSLCRNCEYLLAGMCRKCGCYVEIRAALKNKSCPNADDALW